MILSVSCQYVSMILSDAVCMIPYSLEAVVCLCRFDNWASLVTRLQCGRPGFDPWVAKIPWRRERLRTPVFWPGEFHGLYSPWGSKESDTAERLSPSLSANCGGKPELLYYSALCISCALYDAF